MSKRYFKAPDGHIVDVSLSEPCAVEDSRTFLESGYTECGPDGRPLTPLRRHAVSVPGFTLCHNCGLDEKFWAQYPNCVPNCYNTITPPTEA